MMSKPNILVYSSKQAEEYAECIRKQGYTSVKVARTPEEAERYLPGIEVILGWKFPTKLLTQANIFICKVVSVNWSRCR